MTKIAVYPGTFDPITHGHCHLVARAVQLFDEVILAVAISAGKNPLFSLSERIDLVSQSLAEYPTVKVCGFDKLVVDFAREQGAQTILRGVRGSSDLAYEIPMAEMNRCLAPEIDTVFLAAHAKYTAISSRLVREIASMGGEVAQFVPAPVTQALAQRGKR